MFLDGVRAPSEWGFNKQFFINRLGTLLANSMRKHKYVNVDGKICLLNYPVNVKDLQNNLKYFFDHKILYLSCLQYSL